MLVVKVKFCSSIHGAIIEISSYKLVKISLLYNRYNTCNLKFAVFFRNKSRCLIQYVYFTYQMNRNTVLLFFCNDFISYLIMAINIFLFLCMFDVHSHLKIDQVCNYFLEKSGGISKVRWSSSLI